MDNTHDQRAGCTEQCGNVSGKNVGAISRFWCNTMAGGAKIQQCAVDQCHTESREQAHHRAITDNIPVTDATP